MSNLDINQQTIVESKDSRIVVMATSGSGKTKLLTERVKHLINNGVHPEEIVAITFTNAAADEMKERLGPIATRAYIGTIHGYANRILLSNGIKTQNFLDDEDFDALFELVSENRECVRPVHHLLVDEFQDVTEPQYRFFMELINPQNFFYVGDPDQFIYGFAHADVGYLTNLAEDPDTTLFSLSANYRSAPSIVNFAKRFLKNVKDSFPYKIICINPNRGTLLKIYDDHFNFLLEEIKESESYNDWLILTRTNAQVFETMEFLQINKIPCDTFKKTDFSSDEILNRMKANTVKVLTAHSAKGLESENVAVYGMLLYNDDERRLAYVAATRAKNKLLWFYRKTKG